MPLLIPHLSASMPGMRAASASTLRNMYVLSLETRKEFVASGGVPALVAQLSLPTKERTGKALGEIDEERERHLYLCCCVMVVPRNCVFKMHA